MKEGRRLLVVRFAGSWFRGSKLRRGFPATLRGRIPPKLWTTCLLTILIEMHPTRPRSSMCI
jgi:hypothetical protein